jgi:hypothetical protein
LALRVVDPLNNPKYPGLLSNIHYEHFITESRNITAQMVPPIGADPASTNELISNCVIS